MKNAKLFGNFWVFGGNFGKMKKKMGATWAEFSIFEDIPSDIFPFSEDISSVFA